MNYNSVSLAGNLTRDPELRQVGSTNVCQFGLAINRKWKDANGETKEEATFLDCECWGKTAELVETYLRKGSGAFLVGRLKLETWDDKKTGEKRSKIKVVADQVMFLDRKSDGEQAAPSVQTPTRPTATARPVAPASFDDTDSPPF